MAARTRSITRVLNHLGAKEGYNGPQYPVPMGGAPSGGALTLILQEVYPL